MKINEIYLQKLDRGIRDRVRDYIKSNDKDQCDLINLISFVYDTGCADGYSETVTKADNSIHKYLSRKPYFARIAGDDK